MNLRRSLFLGMALVFATMGSAKAIEGYLLGVQLGQMSPQATGSNGGLFYGIDVGVQNNPVLDVMLTVQRSSHGGVTSVDVIGALITADLHIMRTNDIDASLGAGPGMYFTSGGVSQSNFGIQGGGNIDVIIGDAVRVGIAARYHYIFGTPTTGNCWSGAMRVAYLFGSNS